MKPDLHTHTTASDGLLTPAELVALAAKAYAYKTGICMEVFTTQPGMQLYTGNFLSQDGVDGKTGGPHADITGQAGEKAAREECERNPRVLHAQSVGEEGEEQRQNQKDDRYDLILLPQVGHRALADVGRDLFHAVRSLAAAHHRAKEIPCESESHEGGQRNDPEDKRGVVHRTVVLGCLEFGFDRSQPVRRMASSLSDRLSLLAKKRKHPKLINYFI